MGMVLACMAAVLALIGVPLRFICLVGIAITLFGCGVRWWVGLTA